MDGIGWRRTRRPISWRSSRPPVRVPDGSAAQAKRRGALPIRDPGGFSLQQGTGTPVSSAARNRDPASAIQHCVLHRARGTRPPVRVPDGSAAQAKRRGALPIRDPGGFSLQQGTGTPVSSAAARNRDPASAMQHCVLHRARGTRQRFTDQRWVPSPWEPHVLRAEPAAGAGSSVARPAPSGEPISQERGSRGSPAGLDIYSYRIMISQPRPTEGRFARRRKAGRTGQGAGDAAPNPVAGTGEIPVLGRCGARGFCLASRLPGGAGAPPGGTTAPSQELAHVRDAPRHKREAGPGRKRGPAPSRRRGGAPRGERAASLPASRLASVTRLGASGRFTTPRLEGHGRDEGAPGADQTIRAAERWLDAAEFPATS